MLEGDGAGPPTVWTGEGVSSMAFSSMGVSVGEDRFSKMFCGWKGVARGFAAPLPLPLSRGGIRGDEARTQLIKGDGKQIIEGNLLIKVFKGGRGSGENWF